MFNEVGLVCGGGGGGGAAPAGIPSQCNWICLSIRNTNIYGLGVGI